MRANACREEEEDEEGEEEEEEEEEGCEEWEEGDWMRGMMSWGRLSHHAAVYSPEWGLAS